MSGLFLLMLPVAAHAATVTFNFDTCGNGTTKNASCGSSTTYSSGTYSITATDESSWGTLYAKQNGGDEDGLGLTDDTTGEHEITPGSFIQLSVSSILGNGPLTIFMDSSTGSDAWKVYETNTLGSMTGGTSLKTGSSELGFTLTPGDKYLDITATSGNVLLSSLSFSPAATPEPGSLALLGTGVLGLAGIVRRRLKG